MTPHSQIAASDAPKGKGGGTEVRTAQIQDYAMLKVAERPTEGKAETTEFNGFSDFHRASMWLDEEVKKARKGVTTQVIELTPALAEVLMSRNDGNRNISDYFVDAYARDIENDNWRFNGEPLIISSDGHLNDGQHRATAVIEAGRSIQAVLVIGVDRDTRTTLDQGRIRTGGDYLAMEGHSNANALAAAGNYIWQWQVRGTLSSGGKTKPTKSELLGLINSNPDIAESLMAVPVKGAPAAGGLSLLTFCHWAMSKVAPKAEVDYFIAALTGGANLMSRDPILYARNRLITERSRLRPNDKAELIFRAWNCHRKGEKVSRLPILGAALPTLEA